MLCSSECWDGISAWKKERLWTVSLGDSWTGICKSKISCESRFYKEKVCTGRALRRKVFVDLLAVQTTLKHRKFWRNSQKDCCSKVHVAHCVKQMLACRRSQISHSSILKCTSVLMEDRRSSGMLWPISILLQEQYNYMPEQHNGPILYTCLHFKCISIPSTNVFIVSEIYYNSSWIYTESNEDGVRMWHFRLRCLYISQFCSFFST